MTSGAYAAESVYRRHGCPSSETSKRTSASLPCARIDTCPRGSGEYLWAFSSRLVAVRLGGEVERDAHARERSSKLVRDVRQQLALRLQQLLDPLRHLVERLTDVPQLVGSIQPRACLQIAGA